MVRVLKPIAYWDNMRSDCDRFVDSCRLCASRQRHPRVSAVLKSLAGLKPHTTLVYDLAFITPEGKHGEVGVLTCICAYTKFVWARPIWGKTAADCATALFAVICDSGVIPLTILSDREKSFREKVILELIALVNSRVGYSMAWSPESHGVIERFHQEMHKVLGKTIESLAEAHAEDWPDFVPLTELSYRTRTLDTGEQPIALSRGYYGSTSLQTAMGALKAIPHGLAQSTWMKALLGAHALILDHHETLDEHLRSIRSAVGNEQKGIRPRKFKPGDTVLVLQGKHLTELERIGSKLRGRSTGPWRISTVGDDYATLEDPWTKTAWVDDLNGLPERINQDRLVKFHFVMDDFIYSDPEVLLESIAFGSTVAVINDQEVVLLQVDQFELDVFVEGRIMRVPQQERHGSWHRRPWEFVSQEPVRIVWNDLVCQVCLGEDLCLDGPSLRRLHDMGCEVN